MTWKERCMRGKAYHYSATRGKTACGLQIHEFLYSTRVLKKVNCYRCLKTKVYIKQLISKGALEMTVRKLISELKRMPQNLQVYYAHNDNSPWETAGDVFSTAHCVKEDMRKEFQESIDCLSFLDKQDFESQKKQWVVIRG